MIEGAAKRIDLAGRWWQAVLCIPGKGVAQRQGSLWLHRLFIVVVVVCRCRRRAADWMRARRSKHDEATLGMRFVCKSMRMLRFVGCFAACLRIVNVRQWSSWRESRVARTSAQKLYVQRAQGAIERIESGRESSWRSGSKGKER